MTVPSQSACKHPVDRMSGFDDLITCMDCQEAFELRDYIALQKAALATTPAADEALWGEIWSRSLKYLDLVRQYEAKTSEHYFAYRDAKARDLADDLMAYIKSHAELRGGAGTLHE